MTGDPQRGIRGDGMRGDRNTVAVTDDPVLAPFNAAGVLSPADVHVARRIAALSGEQVPGPVRLATALAVRAVRTGSTCVQLDRLAELAADTQRALAERAALDPSAAVPDAPDWPSTGELVAALQSSPLVTGCAGGPLRPLALAQSLDGPLLYLRKYFRQENAIREILDERAGRRPVVDEEALATALERAFGPVGDGDGRYDRQRAAAALAACSWTTVLAGGPGTGKTYTVARILAVLQSVLGPATRVGLCAPTGRAAAQMQSAIGAYRRQSGLLTGEQTAVTVHRMLGARPDGTFKRGPGNRLPYDVVVVDETSMLSVTLMSRLLGALRADSRLILVGDPHQLVSVEAGAVLADLVDRAQSESDSESGPADAGRPRPELLPAPVRGGADFTGPEWTSLAAGVITLRRGHRYGGVIAAVAEAVNDGRADEVLELIAGEQPGPATVTLVDPEELDPVRDQVRSAAAALCDAALAGDAAGALEALSAHRVLCAHRDGRYGVGGWSRQVTAWIGDDLPPAPDGGAWYPGEPLLVTANDPAQDVYNGDVGVVIADGQDVTTVFERGRQITRLHPSQLADTVPVYAMTIHRSQGSQFGAVTVVLPPAASELLSRELLYTAITRAEHTVRIVGTQEALRAAVQRRVQRASGLRSVVRED